MSHVSRLSGALLAVVLVASPVLAQDAVRNAINARQSVMKLYAFNLGQLGAMAKGELAYDAASASAAADNLAKLTSLDQRAMWLPGSDNATVADTRALPKIWESFPDVGAKAGAVAEAAMAMQAAAGNGLPALQAAIGPLGSACGACHKAYRAPDE